jgi:hypothetical protein
VRDSESLEVLQPGHKGRLHFLAPHPKLSLNISVLSRDEGLVLGNCRCGRKSPILNLSGTAR